MKRLGAAIRDVRRARKLSITGLHYETRIAYQAVCRIERGTVYPKLDTLLRICQALDVKPSVLFAMVDSER